MTRTGDREIVVISGRPRDNPGELACMSLTLKQRLEATRKKSVLQEMTECFFAFLKLLIIIVCLIQLLFFRQILRPARGKHE